MTQLRWLSPRTFASTRHVGGIAVVAISSPGIMEPRRIVPNVTARLRPFFDFSPSAEPLLLLLLPLPLGGDIGAPRVGSRAAATLKQERPHATVSKIASRNCSSRSLSFDATTHLRPGVTMSAKGAKNRLGWTILEVRKGRTETTPAGSLRQTGLNLTDILNCIIFNGSFRFPNSNLRSVVRLGGW